MIFSKVDYYIKNFFAEEDNALTATIDSLDKENIPQYSISANQGKFLQIMMLACNAKRVLELGTLGGYSTIWLARSLPVDGKIITVEFDEHHAEIAQSNIDKAGLTDKVEIRKGKATDEMAKMISEKATPFDLIFIDADKPPYMEYFIAALQLSKKGTIIICDNVIREGEVLNEKSTDEKVNGVRRLNEFVSKCKDVQATILQTVGVKEHDGMLIAVVS